MDLSFLHHPFLGSTTGNYLWFGVWLALTLLLRRLLAALLVKASGKVAIRFTTGKYQRLFRSLMTRPVLALITITGIFAALNRLETMTAGLTLLSLKGKTEVRTISVADVVHHLFLFLAIWHITQLLSRTADFFFRANLERARRNGHLSKLQLLPLVREIAKIFIWVTAFFWVLGAVFLVNIPALITGIGIGGVAIALAAKETVENLFASFTILLDKPLQAGDHIKLGTLEGTVERIGFRSTRLRHADGAMLIIPNKKLIDETLENQSQREVRGIRFAIPVKYSLPAARLRHLVTALEAALRAVPHVQEPVKVLVEPMNENSFQAAVSFRLPYPFLFGHAEDVREAAYLLSYEVVQEALDASDTSSPVDVDNL